MVFKYGKHMRFVFEIPHWVKWWVKSFQVNSPPPSLSKILIFLSKWFLIKTWNLRKQDPIWSLKEITSITSKFINKNHIIQFLRRLLDTTLYKKVTKLKLQYWNSTKIPLGNKNSDLFRVKSLYSFVSSKRP